MLESKIHATERLRREGRWAEASAYRDDVRKRLRSEGKAKSEANELAWEEMISKYTPLPNLDDVNQMVTDGSETLDPLPLPGDINDTDLVRDALCVYGRLAESTPRCRSASNCVRRLRIRVRRTTESRRKRKWIGAPSSDSSMARGRTFEWTLSTGFASTLTST